MLSYYTSSLGVKLIKNHLNMKRALLLMCLILILGFGISTTKICHATLSSTHTATIYMDPPTLVGETVGETLSAFIMVKNFEDMFLWQAGLSFNPDVLNCTSVEGGAGLTDDVFDVLTTNPTMYIPGAIDNVAGKVGYSSQGLQGVVPGVTGDPDVGYKILKFNFEVTGVGVSDLHLMQTFLLDSTGAKMALNLVDVFTAVYPPTDETLYPVYILTNSTAKSSNPPGQPKIQCGPSQHAFTPEEKKLNFTVTIVNAVSPNGFCNVTIPKTLMSCDDPTGWEVTINGELPLSFPTPPTVNDTHTLLYFEYEHPTSSPYTLKIQITSTWVVPEFPTTIILSLFMILTMIAVISWKLLQSTKHRGRIVARQKAT